MNKNTKNTRSISDECFETLAWACEKQSEKEDDPYLSRSRFDHLKKFTFCIGFKAKTKKEMPLGALMRYDQWRTRACPPREQAPQDEL